MTDQEAGIFFLKNHICVHLQDFKHKYDCIVLMIQKLYAVVSGECECDNMDSVAMQDVMLSGHFY